METVMRIAAPLAAIFLLLIGTAFAQETEEREISPENVLVLDLEVGTVFIEMYPDIAPAHVERIRTLANQGFYDNTVFHRVIEGFMAQGGDPTGTGTGGSELPDLPAEFSTIPHRRGMVSMARSQDVNSANSQFFVMLADRPDGAPTWSQLDGTYTVWGRVIEGMEHVDEIALGEPPEEPTEVVRARIAATEFPGIPFVAGPADIRERTEFASMEAQTFDPLFEDDVEIDILTPVLNRPN